MDHGRMAGQSPGLPAAQHHLSDFEVTVEYPAFTAAQGYLDDDGPTMAEVAEMVDMNALETVPDGSRPDIAVPSYLEAPSDPVRDAVQAALRAPEDYDTTVCEEPSEVRAMMVPPSHSLIADAEAIMAAFRPRSAPQLLWAQRMASQVVALPEPPSRRRWWSRATGAVIRVADRIGGAIVDTSVAAYRWVQSSALGRRLRRRPCNCCNARRARYTLYFHLPAELGVGELTHYVEQRSWDLFRCVGPAHTQKGYLQLSIDRCRRCVDDTTVEITAHRSGSGQLIASDMKLVDDESYFLLSLAR